MPGEKEIIPPMAEILLDMGHTSFAVPILKRYIETKGWNDVMRGFSKHTKLQGKWSQEGLRFLQFYGQKPGEFRRFIFGVYVRKFIAISFFTLMLTLLVLSYFYFNFTGVIAVLCFYIATIFSMKGTIFLINRKKFSD